MKPQSVLLYGWMVCVMAVSAVRADAKAVGGSVPSYLVGRDLPENVAMLEQAGRLTDAEEAIKAILTSNNVNGPTTASLAIERERLVRLKRDYSLTSGALLTKLRDAIPDVTQADIDKWTKKQMLQWMRVDGETRYFRREPSNLFRKDKDAQKRRDAAAKEKEKQSNDPAGKSTKKFSLPEHMAACLAASDATSKTVVLPVRVRATHSIAVKAGEVPAGKTIRCWMPYPQEYRQQTDVRLIATTPAVNHVAPNGAGHRTVYMEQPAAADKATTFTAEFEWTIGAFVPSIDPDKAESLSPKDPIYREFTAEKPPHVLITPEVKKLAAKIVGKEKNPFRKAEKIYLWMDKNIHYCSEMEYAVMPAISQKIMAERSGDCGVQALLFITLCRASGVPARWQSGWVARPGNWNMHDWAEFYVKPWGWLPADPSVGLQKSDDPRVHSFLIGHLDSYRLIANSDFCEAFDPPKTHWRSDPVDNQRGEVEWEGGNLYYDQWTYDVKIEFPK